MRNRRYNKSMLLLLIIFLAVERITTIAAAGGSFVTSALDWIMETLLTLPAILIGLSFHEYAHAKASVLCGDSTPEKYGRVSLNPTAHIDPMGFVSLIFLGFGWGIPVPITSAYYKNPRLGEIFVGLSGVGMNLFIAIVVGLVIKLILVAAPVFAMGALGSIILYILMKICWINLLLMGFNLIPCPPLDGFNVLANIFHFRYTEFYYFVQNRSTLLLIILVVFEIPSKILMTPLLLLTDFIYGTVMQLPWAYLLLVSPV